MVPDKIYVKEFVGEISQLWSSIKATVTTANAQHEYLRKGALLEWAKEQASSVEKLNGRGSMLKAYDNLIEKLNSM